MHTNKEIKQTYSRIQQKSTFSFTRNSLDCFYFNALEFENLSTRTLTYYGF